MRIDPGGTAGWADIGAIARWDGGDEWRLQFGLGNLLDKKYRVHGSGIDASGRSLSAGVRRLW